MDYENLSDEVLYRLFKMRVPETFIERVDDCNRNTVIAVLKITETKNGNHQEGKQDSS